MTGMQLALQWAETLRDNEALNAFCAEKLGKALTVGVGFDAARQFGVAEAPHIFIAPASDSGGPEAEQREYVLTLYLGIAGPKKDVVKDGIVLSSAMNIMDSEFAPLVMAVLNDDDCPPLQGEGTLFPAENGYCEKIYTVSYTEDQPIRVKMPWA